VVREPCLMAPADAPSQIRSAANVLSATARWPVPERSLNAPRPFKWHPFAPGAYIVNVRTDHCVCPGHVDLIIPNRLAAMAKCLIVRLIMTQVLAIADAAAVYSQLGIPAMLDRVGLGGHCMDIRAGRTAGSVSRPGKVIRYQRHSRYTQWVAVGSGRMGHMYCHE
jgi:hypothetical protein